MCKVREVFQVTQETARRLRVFESRGQGEGNKVTNRAMAEINAVIARKFGTQVVQRVLAATNRQSVDFYFEDEGTIVEIEFSFSNPYPCLEKDAFKALLAKAGGLSVRRLVIFGDPGAIKRSNAAAPRAIIDWLLQNHQLSVEVLELSR